MGIESCDCNAFERRDGTISCESLMAGEISSLKGKQLPRDLLDMDQREYAVIKAEEADLEKLSSKLGRLGFGAISLVILCVSAIIGVVNLIFGRFLVALISFFATGLSTGGVITACRHTKAKRNKIQDIDDNRLARLQSKVGVLERKIAVTMDESKEDLIAAKDFFKTKHEIYLARKNKPIVISQVIQRA